MAREGRSRFGRWAGVFLVAVVAVLLLRILGPGGRPAVDRRGPAPAPAPAAGPSSSSSVGGRVLLAEGGPAAGAEVEAVFDPGGGAPPVSLRSGPAGADGRFALAGAPAKWTSLRIRARRGPLSVDADLGDAPGPLSLDLRLPATWTAAGIVIAAEDGRPLPGMEVRLGERAVRTDPLGRFSLGAIPAPAAGADPPVLEISGAGRRTLRHALPPDRSADDLLLRAERP